MSSARSLQALELVDRDASNPNRGESLPAVRAAFEVGPTYLFVDSLWNDTQNEGVRNAFMNNKLCAMCAKGDPNALAYFQNYAIQDYFYLVDYVKFKALRLTTIPPGDFETLSSEAQGVGKSTGYVTDWMTTCVTQLGVNPQRFTTEERSVAELAYANYLQNNAKADDWFNLHVIMVACTYGWSKLALKLYNDPTTVKDTVFYNTWILPNLDLTGGLAKLSTSANKLSTFLDTNRGIWSAQIDQPKWNGLFRTGLRLEVALFNSAFSPYGN